MKDFIIINGKDCLIIQAVDKNAAICRAIDISDHSKEILVREINLDCLCLQIDKLTYNPLTNLSITNLIKLTNP